jgi:hypothetical protein
MDKYFQKLLIIVFIASSFAFLQCSSVYPALNQNSNNKATKFFVCGWPYVALFGTTTKPKPVFPPDDRFWNFRMLIANCVICLFLSVVCYFGLTRLIVPKFSKFQFQLSDLVAGMAGLSFATAFMCGFCPPLLRTGVNLYYSFAEITIFDRTIFQRAVIAVTIGLTGFTLVSSLGTFFQYGKSNGSE